MFLVVKWVSGIVLCKNIKSLCVDYFFAMVSVQGYYESLVDSEFWL